jgi:DNA primase large subunit
MSLDCNAPFQRLSCLFPFLESTGEHLYARGFTLEAALENDRLVEKAIEIARGAIRGRQTRTCAGEEEAAAAARLALYIIAASGNQYAVRRFADRESKLFAARLRGLQAPCKMSIAADLGVRVRPSREVVKGVLAAYFPLAVWWVHYLRYAPQEWAMINRPVVKGWALVKAGEFERLLEEAYERRILALASREDIGYIASQLAKRPEVDELLTELRAYRPAATAAKATGPYPPCMQAIMDAIKRGENVPHTARFAITAYLLKRGWGVDEVVELFRSSPDFNERITRYQVQHIAGQVGGRKEYSVPNCETMRAWGLCPTNLGCGVKNPMQYGRPVRRGREGAITH